MTPSPAMITGNTASTAATADAPLMPLMAVYMRRCAQRKENEFFEPQLMSNPPPMASEFLSDLRKMISVARERIRTRRHVPRLAPVVESEDEGRATPAVNNTTTDGGAGGGILAKVTTKSIGEMKKEEKKVNENEENNLKIAKANDVDVEDKENSNSILTSMEEIVQEQQKRRRGSKGEEDEEKQKEESKVHREEAEEMMEERAIEMDEETTATQSSLVDFGNANNNHKEEEENIANDVPTENMPNGRNEENGESTVEEEAKIDESRDSDQLPDQMPLHVTNATASPSSTPIQQQSTTNPSRIPVGTVANGKSPRMQFKFSALCRRAPPLPPRPPPTISNDNGRMNEVNAQQSWQKKPGGGQNPLAAAKRRITTTTANNNASSGTEMEEGAIFKQPLAALSASTATGIPIGGFAVAVCPPPSFACGDRMKKSLPRRKKAIAPQPISMPPNTAVLPKTAAPTAV